MCEAMGSSPTDALPSHQWRVPGRSTGRGITNWRHLNAKRTVPSTKYTRSRIRLVPRLSESQRPYGESTSNRTAAWFSPTIHALRMTAAVILKLSTPCIVDQRIFLLYQPNVPHQIYINIQYTTPTCFGKNIKSSASICAMLKTSCKWLNNLLFRKTSAQHIY